MQLTLINCILALIIEEYSIYFYSITNGIAGILKN